ncbi:MAG: YfcE family phosphodiesterase [Chloroflexota bacterium]
MRIGVLSDTHIPDRAKTLPAPVLEVLRDCATIIHAGDFCVPAVLEELRCLAPVHAVYGNMDSPELKMALLRRLVVEIGGARIGIVHGDSSSFPARAVARRTFAADGVACVIYGHSHLPERTWEGGVLYLNPGSPTDPRRATRCSFGILTIEGGQIDAQLQYL